MSALAKPAPPLPPEVTVHQWHAVTYGWKERGFDAKTLQIFGEYPDGPRPFLTLQSQASNFQDTFAMLVRLVEAYCDEHHPKAVVATDLQKTVAGWNGRASDVATIEVWLGDVATEEVWTERIEILLALRSMAVRLGARASTDPEMDPLIAIARLRFASDKQKKMDEVLRTIGVHERGEHDPRDSDHGEEGRVQDARRAGGVPRRVAQAHGSIDSTRSRAAQNPTRRLARRGAGAADGDPHDGAHALDSVRSGSSLKKAKGKKKR